MEGYGPVLKQVEDQVTEALHFLSLLFAPKDWIEVRLLPSAQSRWFQLSDEAATDKVLRWAIERNSQENDPQNVFIGANPRCASGKRTKESVTMARALFADFDGITVEEALARIRKAGLPEPSVVIVTGGGCHAYWLLLQPMTNLSEWTATIKGIIKAVGSDKSVHDAPRVMRLPGTRNVKPDRPGRPWCQIVSTADTRHEVASFATTILSKPETSTELPTARGSLCDIARRFLETGHVDRPRRESLFTICCDMQANGWSEKDAVKAVMSRVGHIHPPLDADQIDDLPRQIHNAFKQQREPGHTAAKATLADAAKSKSRRLVLVRASEIECTAINWLWPQRIVGDGLTIITGLPGISKSLISVDVAARVSTGGKWPDGTGHAPQGSVILFGAEDDAGKVVVPRLAAAGADLSRIHVCQGTLIEDEDDEANDELAAVILERHIGELRDALDEVADCRLIVFDPLPDYIAADENKSAEVRAALVPLAKLAQERNVAVVAVLHQNKKNDLTTVQRISGSGAFAQVARVVLAIRTHPDDVEKESDRRRVMIVSKSNYGERNVGQAYEIETRSNGCPALVWHAGTLTMDADEIARRPTGGRDHEARRSEAVDALRDMLAAGEQNAATVIETLQDSGLGRRQIDYAAATLNVVKTKAKDGWYWRLPARSVDDNRPLPDPAFAAFSPSEWGDCDTF